MLNWGKNYFSTDWGKSSSEWSTSIGFGSFETFLGLPGPRFGCKFSLSCVWTESLFLGLPLLDFYWKMHKPFWSTSGTRALVFLLGRYVIYYYNLKASRKSCCSCYTSSPSSEALSWAASSISVSSSINDSISLSVISSLRDTVSSSSSSSDQEFLFRRLWFLLVCCFWQNFCAFF